VFSKQTNKFFDSNRNKPKLNQFRLIFDLFRETGNFDSFCFGIFNPFRHNKSNQNKYIYFETNQKNEKSNLKTRVSTKKTKKNFGSNRNIPKLNLFRLISRIVCFAKPKNKIFRFVLVFRIRIETTKTNSFETNGGARAVTLCGFGSGLFGSGALELHHFYAGQVKF
jgi:hypothetical protein